MTKLSRSAAALKALAATAVLSVSSAAQARTCFVEDFNTSGCTKGDEVVYQVQAQAQAQAQARSHAPQPTPRGRRRAEGETHRS